MKNVLGASGIAFVISVLTPFVFPNPVTAATPQTINYQGSLSSGGTPVNGATNVTFRLYDLPSGGTSLWSETQSVSVVNGLFSVSLGSITTFASANLAFDVPYFLGISVNMDSEMTPRPPLTSAPYALRAQTAEGLTALRIASNAGNSSLIGGAAINAVATATSSVIGGGGGAGLAGAPSPDATVPLTANLITGAANASVISGGSGNIIEYNATTRPVFATIAGGQNNKNYSYFGFVGGGRTNTAGQVAASIFGATVGGGFGNSAFGSYSVIGGGSGNQAASFASVPGGVNNLALGQYSFAGGRGAYSSNDAPGTIRHHGTFVWADSNANDAINQQSFFSTAVDQFAVRARGGVAFRVASTTNADTGAGCSLPAGGAASWSCSSDRNLKESISAISPQDVLAKVAALPLSTWSFKGTDRRHMGPMAQDFRAAFGLGVDDRNITTSDVGGVALAAIQGLYQLLQERDREIARLQSNEQELAKLRRELSEIKSALGLK